MSDARRGKTSWPEDPDRYAEAFVRHYLDPSWWSDDDQDLRYFLLWINLTEGLMRDLEIGNLSKGEVIRICDGVLSDGTKNLGRFVAICSFLSIHCGDKPSIVRECLRYFIDKCNDMA